MENNAELIELTTEIVAAYVGSNSVGSGDLPGLIQTVFRALSNLSHPVEAAPEPAKDPAVPIKKSITSDYLILSLIHI